jgi:hypothetical protein
MPAEPPPVPLEYRLAWREFLLAARAAAERRTRRAWQLAAMLTGRAPLALPPPEKAATPTKDAADRG